MVKLHRYEMYKEKSVAFSIIFKGLKGSWDQNVWELLLYNNSIRPNWCIQPERARDTDIFSDMKLTDIQVKLHRLVCQ